MEGKKGELISHIIYFIISSTALVFFSSYILEAIILGEEFKPNWGIVIGIGFSSGIIVYMFHSSYWEALFKGKRWWWQVLFIVMLGVSGGVIAKVVNLLIQS